MDDWTFEKSFFRNEIRRVNLTRMALALLVLAAIVLLDTRSTAVQLVYRLRGAAPVSRDELTALSDPESQLTPMPFPANQEASPVFESDTSLRRLMLVRDGRCIVTVVPQAVLPTEYDAVEQSGRVSSSVEYVYADLGGRLMIVKRSKARPLDELTGTVGYLPRDILSAVAAASGRDEAEILPVLMDTTLETFASLTTDTACSAAALLLWGLWAFFIVRRAMRVDRSPAYKRLFSCHGTVEENARAIDLELAQHPDFGLFGDIVTENWHIRRRPFSFLVEPRSSYLGG